MTKKTAAPAKPQDSQTQAGYGTVSSKPGNKFKHPAIVFEVPALHIDKLLYHARNPMPSHGKVERRIVYNLVRYLEANGFRAPVVFDGEEWHPTKNVLEVMEICFDLDEVSLRVRKATDSQALMPRTKYTEHGIAMIFGNGNNGLDLISDYTFSSDDSDNFGAIMDEFDSEVFA